MHKIHLRGLATTVALVATIGCSNVVNKPESELNSKLPRELSVYAVRKSITGTEYERYVISKNILYSECGKLSDSPKAATTAKSDLAPVPLQLGRYRAERKSIYARELSNAEKAELGPDIQNAIDQLNRNKDRQADHPDLDSVGIFEVLVNEDSLPSPAYALTSFDSVSDKGNSFNSTLRRLFKKLRSVPGSQCSEAPFFGIGVFR